MDEATIDALRGQTATGEWSIEEPTEPHSSQNVLRGFLWPIGIGAMLALSSVTSVPDPWIVKQHRRTQPTVQIVLEVSGRRRLSRREARAIALHLLERMEMARLEAATDEARRAIPLEGLW